MSLCCSSFLFVLFDFIYFNQNNDGFDNDKVSEGKLCAEDGNIQISRFSLNVWTDWMQYSSMQMTPVQYLQIRTMITQNTVFISY